MREAFVYLLASAMLVGVGYRLAQIEATQGEALAKSALKGQTRTVKIPAQRGSILDTQGRILATSLRKPSLFMDAYYSIDAKYTAHTLAPILQTDAAALEQELRIHARAKHKNGAPRRHNWVRRHITPEQADKIREVCAIHDFKAFGIQEEVIRVYPRGTLAAHVLGFWNEFGPGTGVELRYQEQLSGSDGKYVEIIDGSRERIAHVEDEYEAPQDGQTIVLTIDSHIQATAEQHVQAAVEKYEAKWGTAVVMDPRTGEVLAMANFPTFDPGAPVPPGLKHEEAFERMRNRAMFDMYEPGSIFKPFIAAKALQDGLTYLGEIFEIDGPERYFGRRRLRDSHAHERLTLEGVISESSNIGMAMLGERLTNERMHRYVSEFGFGKPTDVGLLPEASGILHDKKNWTKYSTHSIPIGQEIAATAIQIATAFCVLSNDGTLFQPRIVRGFLNSDGEMLEDHSAPIAKEQLLSPDVALNFRRTALGETVRTGTGKKLGLPDYQVFGKTGTAQVAETSKEGYAAKSYMSSFVGGAPLDHPRVVVLVSIYKPKKSIGYYGSEVAGPVFANILAETLSYLQVPPDKSLATPPALPERADR